MNIEVAHKLSEQDRVDRAKRRWEEIIEILEVLILAVAAIATAWSGYQAARGDGRQSVLYGESSRDRFEADAAATLGEQRLAADASMFNAWLQARAAGNRELQATFVRRFRCGHRQVLPQRPDEHVMLLRHQDDPLLTGSHEVRDRHSAHQH